MSVLDRAIVKAFERRQVSAPPVRVSHETECVPVDLPASVTSNEVLTPPTVAAPIAEPVQATDPDCIEPPTQRIEEPPEIPAPAESLDPPASVDPTPVTSESPTPLPTPAVPEAVKPPPAPVPAPASKPPSPPLSETREWHWPEICEQLDQFTGDGFRQLAKHLQFAAVQGSKVLAFVSSGRETGRTSVVLTLTRILALEGLTKALLIDADRRHPDIATLTGQTSAPGLAEVLHGQAKPQQAIVARSPGNVSTLTLTSPVSDAEWTKLIGQMRALMQQAKRNFDMVLIDAGVFGPDTRLNECWLRGVADAVITVSRQLSATNTNHDVLDWKQIGIESLGVIETFS